ncbi:MAG: hypothetical protein DLM59_04385 [Pseudonocardiales bacterium]|nr:MAG: hypothetical protein DLM59_04385 [Pseudonocardiales bacterium]
MNAGIQDAVDLAQILAAVIGDGAPEGALDAYERRRRPVAQDVVALTDRATRMATVHARPARAARNLVIGLVGRLPAVRYRIAYQVAELARPG